MLKLPRRILSLRLLMLAILAIGLWLGWVTNRARQQRKAIEAIRECGGSVSYSDRPEADDPAVGQRSWSSNIIRLLGVDLFRDVKGVSLDGHINIIPDPGDSVAVHDYARLTDSAVDQLPCFPKLKHLSLLWAQVSPTRLERIGRLSRLESLLIIGDPTPEREGLTDTGLGSLKKLRSLRSLSIERSIVTDAGLEQLMGMPNLKSLNVRHAKGVTPQGIQRLKAAMPGLEVAGP